MSFDLYFVDLGAGETFADAMERMEDAAEAHEHEGESHRELSDDATGIRPVLHGTSGPDQPTRRRGLFRRGR